MTRGAVLGGVAIAIAALAWDPAAPAADPKRAVGLVVAIVACALAARTPPAAGPSRAVAALAAFAAWSGLTLAWGVPAGARDLATFLVAAALAVALDAGPPARARDVAGVAAAIAGAGASVVAIVERAGGARGLAVHGGQGNANWLGLLLAVALPLTLDVAAAGRAPRPLRLAAASAFAIELVGLALARSRVAWIAAAVTTVPLALALAPRPRRPLVALVLAAPLVALAVALTRAPAPAPPADLPRDEDVPAPIALEGRLWIARASMDAARDAVPLGVGLGGFAHAFLDAQGARLAPLPPKVASRRFVNATTAHDDWIEALVDSGPVAPALLALALGLGALAAARTGFLAGAAALTAVAVGALGDSPIRQPAIALLLGPTLAAAGDARLRLRARRALDVAALAACALAAAYAVAAWIGDRRLAAARQAIPDERLRALSAAQRVDPTNGEIALERGLVALHAARPSLDAAIADLRRSRRLLANVGTDVALGNAHVLAGDLEDARSAYERALARNPGSFRAHANLAEPLIRLGRLDEADRHLAVAAELWPGHPKLAALIDRARRARLDRAAGAD